MDPKARAPQTSIEELTTQLISGSIDRRTFLRRGAMLAISIPTLSAIIAACSGVASSGAPGSTVASAVASAAASAAAAKGPSDKPVIAFLLRNKLQSRWDFDEAGFIAEAEKLGVPYATSFTQGDTQEFQNAKAEAMLASGTLKALVLVPFGELAIQPIIDSAHAKGCKIIAYGNIIPNVDFSLIRDNEKVGKIMGESAKAYAPKGNYIFEWGAVGNDVGEGKKKGTLSVLQPLIDSGDIKNVAEQHTTDWASTGVQTHVEAALTNAKNDIQAIVCSWDTGAIGAYAAVKAAGIDTKVFITGEDADPTRVQLIAAGYPAMTTFEPYPLQGATGADVAYALATGADITKPINGLPVIQVTAPDGKQYPAIQFKSISLTRDNLIEELVKPGLMAFEDVFKLTPEASRPPKP
jgi:D-xylose transport system substrate-binding protein